MIRVQRSDFGSNLPAPKIADNTRYDTAANLSVMGVAAAWQRGYFGQSVTIAMIGYGYNAHAEIDNNIVAGRNIVADSASGLATQG